MELRPTSAEPESSPRLRVSPPLADKRLSCECPRASVRHKGGTSPWICLFFADGIVSSGLGSLDLVQHGVWDKPTDRQAMVIGEYPLVILLTAILSHLQLGTEITSLSHKT
jgi:hypothetical protein